MCVGALILVVLIPLLMIVGVLSGDSSEEQAVDDITAPGARIRTLSGRCSVCRINIASGRPRSARVDGRSNAVKSRRPSRNAYFLPESLKINAMCGRNCFTVVLRRGGLSCAGDGVGKFPVPIWWR